MILFKAALALGISVAALLISVALDTLLAPLPTLVQLPLQITALVLALDAVRQWLQIRVPVDIDLNAMFFLAAPLAAAAATDMFHGLSKLFQAVRQ